MIEMPRRLRDSRATVAARITNRKSVPVSGVCEQVVVRCQRTVNPAPAEPLGVMGLAGRPERDKQRQKMLWRRMGAVSAGRCMRPVEQRFGIARQ